MKCIEYVFIIIISTILKISIVKNQINKKHASYQPSVITGYQSSMKLSSCHQFLWFPGLLHTNDCPVMSAGFSTPITSKMVGATSHSAALWVMLRNFMPFVMQKGTGMEKCFKVVYIVVISCLNEVQESKGKRKNTYVSRRN